MSLCVIEEAILEWRHVFDQTNSKAMQEVYIRILRRCRKFTCEEIQLALISQIVGYSFVPETGYKQA